MRYLVLLLCLCFNTVWANERITPELIKQFLSSHSTYVMQKESDKLMTLFADNYQQFDKTSPQNTDFIDKNALKKIYQGNFLVAKLIINTIQLTEQQIADDGQSAHISTHLFNRYLIEYADKQNILTHEEDWVSDIILENGNVRYLKTEKKAQPVPTN